MRSNLIEQLITLEEGKGGDAIFLTFREDNRFYVKEHRWVMANAIIQKIPTLGGHQWVLRGLYNRLGGNYPAAGSGIYGDINYVAKMAEAYHSHDPNHSEWIQANYIDADFPPNLLPM